MRIATYNVNGINARLPRLLEWLDEARPDVACLQELKADGEKIPVQAIEDAGYGAIWHGQKGFNGVAILARDAQPVERRRGLPDDPDETHSRYIEAEVGGVVIASIYLPNGNPQPGPKFDYKLAWMDQADRSCRDAARRGEAGGAGRRLQRHPQGHRHLLGARDGGRRADPAREPRRAAPADPPGLDRRDPRPPSRTRAALHLLGLSGRRLGDATRASGSIICCSARRRPTGWSMPMSTRPCAGARRRRITRRPGWSCADRQPCRGCAGGRAGDRPDRGAARRGARHLVDRFAPPARRRRCRSPRSPTPSPPIARCSTSARSRCGRIPPRAPTTTASAPISQPACARSASSPRSGAT